MSSPNYDYVDGNAAAGELSKVFAVDITTAARRCAEYGTTSRTRSLLRSRNLIPSDNSRQQRI